jgi:hypothetical protein
MTACLLEGARGRGDGRGPRHRPEDASAVGAAGGGIVGGGLEGVARAAGATSPADAPPHANHDPLA